MSFVNTSFVRRQKHARNSSRHSAYSDSANRHSVSSPKPEPAIDDDVKPEPRPKSRHRLSNWFRRITSDDGKKKPTPSPDSNMSNTTGSVGAPNIYADGDQRNYKKSELGGDRFHEGQVNSHLANDSSMF
jgi:hypothetical protein